MIVALLWVCAIDAKTNPMSIWVSSSDAQHGLHFVVPPICTCHSEPMKLRRVFRVR